MARGCRVRAGRVTPVVAPQHVTCTCRRGGILSTCLGGRLCCSVSVPRGGAVSSRAYSRGDLCAACVDSVWPVSFDLSTAPSSASR